MSLAGKIVVITGGAQGIGRACVEEFERRDARVISVDQIPGATFLGDVTDENVAEQVLVRALDLHGRADILVNNAGLSHKADFLALTSEEFEAVLDVNLLAPFRFSQTFARYWVKEKIKGVIVNMSSVNAVLAIPDQIAYVVSKGGLNQLTKVTAVALAKYGIRVNAVGPGTILTELAKKAVMNDPASEQRVLARTPLGRLGDPAEVAKVVAFLASDDASYLTGQTIYPDGGRLALNYTVEQAPASPSGDEIQQPEEKDGG
jgi:glucose 1-dehydrogenase